MHRIRALVHPVIVAIAAVVLSTSVGGAASAGQDTFFRIGTGGADGTYYPVGRLIARALTPRRNGDDCEAAACGVEGLVAVAQISNGSVSNVENIETGKLEAGLAQSDVIQWAYSGTGTFVGRERFTRLRAVANLYRESVHLVALKASGIRSVLDLRGKRVSLDEPGSGTLVDARLILAAFGLSENDIRAEYVKPDLAIDRMTAGKLDAFFIVAGYPVRSIASLAERRNIVVVPIDGARARALLERDQFFVSDAIPASTYRGVGKVSTIGVGAQLVVDANLPEALVYRVTRILWSPETRKLLRGGHKKGAEIRLDRALDGISIPLHDGAARYYRELGLVE